ncbi:MAG: FkbM family methyltransferase [Chthoniobacterales bacterium]|nr:FkbM family methyltransferase [Chthoniobacterales bacterium]
MKIAAQKIIELFGYELRRKAEILGNSRSGFPSEPFEAQYQLMKIFSRDVVNIFDIGAYKGQTAKEYRSKFPTANIYCFEPFPDSIVELRKRFAEDQHIHIIPKAVAQQDGKAIFHVNELDATNSLLPRPVSGRRYYPKSAGPKATIEVEVICLDSFVRETRISQIDIQTFRVVN